MSNFNDRYDLNALKSKLEEVQQTQGSSDYPEIPVGKYEVKIEKIELRENKNGNPMCSIRFKIVDGEFANSLLFYNQTLIGTDKEGKQTVLGLHLNNEFLRSLDSGLTIEFNDFDQYADLLEDVAYETKKLVYLIEYSKKGDFPTYKVKEIYED